MIRQDACPKLYHCMEEWLEDRLRLTRAKVEELERISSYCECQEDI